MRDMGPSHYALTQAPVLVLRRTILRRWEVFGETSPVGSPTYTVAAFRAYCIVIRRAHRQIESSVFALR